MTVGVVSNPNDQEVLRKAELGLYLFVKKLHLNGSLGYTTSGDGNITMVNGDVLLGFNLVNPLITVLLFITS